MDIFTKINLLSSIGLISSSIGIGTLNGTEKNPSSDEGIWLSDSEEEEYYKLEKTVRSLRKKVKEVGKTLQEDPSKKSKGTINIDGITYKISSKIYKGKRATTIASYFQGELLAGKVDINEQRDIDEQLKGIIVRRTMDVLFECFEAPLDMKKTAIKNLGKFYKSQVLSASNKRQLKLSLDRLRSDIDGQVQKLIEEVESKDNAPEQKTAAMELLSIFYTSPAISGDSKEQLKAFINGKVQKLIEEVESESNALEQKTAAMGLLSILYTFPAISGDSKEKIARFYLKTCRDIIILYNIICYFMDKDQKETLWALINNNYFIFKKDAFIIRSYRDIRLYHNLLHRLSKSEFYIEYSLGNKEAAYYRSKYDHMANMLILLPKFFPHSGITAYDNAFRKTPNASNKNTIIDDIIAFNGDKTISDLNVISNTANTADRILNDIKKYLKKIQNKLEQPNELERKTYDEFKEQLASFKYEASKIVKRYNRAHNMVLIANACEVETQIEIFKDFAGSELQTHFGAISGAIQRGQSEWFELAEEIERISEKLDTMK
jgi:hypothetical protein